MGNRRGTDFLNKVTIAACALALVSASVPVRADEGGAAPGTSPTPVAGDLDMDQVCKSTLDAAANTPAQTGTDQNSPAQQKLQLCQAAQQAGNAATTDKVLTGVWSAVAATCTTVCALSF